MNKAQLRDHILEEMTVLGAGQNASAEDAKKINTHIDLVHGKLERLGVALWKSDDVPDYAVDDVAGMVIANCGAFGQPTDPRKARFHEGELRRLTRDPNHGIGTADYY